jgi:hypothetical protein
MKTELDTYRTLRRIPLDEMEALVEINNFKSSVPPVYRLGGGSHDSSTYYRRDLEIQNWRNKLLEKNGWTFDEFVIELEKRAILVQVAEFNRENHIPYEIMDRAKQYFPNVKFVHAKVELE